MHIFRIVLALAVVGYFVWNTVFNMASHGVIRVVDDSGVGNGHLTAEGQVEVSGAGEGPSPGSSPLTSVAGSLTDQDGRLRKMSEFRGTPFVASAIYTRCPTVCPLTMKTLQALERSLPAGDVPRIVLVSLDPEHDTPSALRAYARAYGLTYPRWTLLQPDTAALRGFTHVLGIGASANTNGGIIHTAAIAVVDSSGRIGESLYGTRMDPKQLRDAWRNIGMTQRVPAD
jgi:protein SCO1/2